MKKTFPHGNLKEKIYLEQPNEFNEVKAISKTMEFDMKDLGVTKKILGMDIHMGGSSRKL
ncbi:hypothetical protein CR513_62557, partial [Mucuna pruriens]